MKLLGWILVVFGVLMILYGCGIDGFEGLPKPDKELKFYAGDASDATIKRKQVSESISTSDPKFNDYVCMDYKTLSCVYMSYVFNGLTWKTLTPKCPELTTGTVKRTMEKYSSLIERKPTKAN